MQQRYFILNLTKVIIHQLLTTSWACTNSSLVFHLMLCSYYRIVALIFLFANVFGERKQEHPDHRQIHTQSLSLRVHCWKIQSQACWCLVDARKISSRFVIWSCWGWVGEPYNQLQPVRADMGWGRRGAGKERWRSAGAADRQAQI